MIYFDNSATTFFKPKEVIKALIDGATTYSSNPGRSGHKLSQKTAEKVFDVRNLICEFLSCDRPEHIIFTQNCTDALNLGVLGTVQKGGHIICSVNDHNSLARPIFELQKQGLIDVSIATPKNQEFLTAEDIEPLIKQNTYMVAINAVSNVNGDSADLKGIGELCAKHCFLFLVDCAQLAGHEKIDMQKLHIDMLALAPHKALFAPQGVGVFAFGVRAKVMPIRFGGTGTSSVELLQPNEYPECLESGTLATPNILALGEAIKYVNNNFEKINEKVDDLATYLLFELSRIENVTIYTHSRNIHYGVIGFNIDGMDSGVVANILSEKYGIYIRGGLHCAGLKHKAMNTIKNGVARISISHANTFGECEYFIKCIKKIIKENMLDKND